MFPWWTELDCTEMKQRVMHKVHNAVQIPNIRGLRIFAKGNFNFHAAKVFAQPPTSLMDRFFRGFFGGEIDFYSRM